MSQKTKKKSNAAIKAKEAGLEFRVSEETREKLHNASLGQRHSTETRQKLSVYQTQWLAENPEKHPWRRPEKFKSPPCEFLKKLLKEAGIPFIEEWKPIGSRGFSVDVAFPDIKVGIEVNGHQHYDNGALKSYYQTRHDLIVEEGWRLLEVPSMAVYRQGFLQEVKDFLGNISSCDYSEFLREKDEEKKQRVSEALEKKRSREQARQERISQRVSLILESDIDFSVFGWVSKVSNLLSIPTSNVNIFMKKHLASFYEEKCFKRHGPVSPRPPKPSLKA